LNLEYFTDDEYQRAFFEFGGFREEIARRIHEIILLGEAIVLDLLSGHGLLSLECRKIFPHARLICTGLLNDAESYRSLQITNLVSTNVLSQIYYIICNATRIPLKSASCDAIVNFLGLEDVNMLYGESGVKSVFEEASRLLKPNGFFQISFVEYGNHPAEMIAQEVWESIGLNAVFYRRDEYVELLKIYDFEVYEEFTLKHNKKMTLEQSKEEIQFACNEAPRIYSGFGVKAIRFDEIWKKFSERIMSDGMGYWSPVRVMIFSK
jgi:ubiquinone/menaquinone biosynthesis C-methylase UbiE